MGVGMQITTSKNNIRKQTGSGILSAVLPALRAVASAIGKTLGLSALAGAASEGASQIRLMLLLCSMMSITLSVETIKNAKMLQTEKWSVLWMQCLGMRDNGSLVSQKYDQYQTKSRIRSKRS